MTRQLPVKQVFIRLLPAVRRYLQQNAFSGSLPPAWGAPGAAPALRYLHLGGSPLRRPLPEKWGQAGGFPLLRSL